MLSIQFHYSEDRKDLFEQVVRIMSGNTYFNQCEKLVFYNTECSFSMDGFQTVQLPLPFCRMQFWKAGLTTEKDKILYLDTDRLFPLDFFQVCDDLLDVHDFVYPANHFQMRFNAPDNFLKRLIADTGFFDFVKTDMFNVGETRTNDITDAVGRRNPMSGCLGYTKSIAQATLPEANFVGWGFSDMLWFQNVQLCKLKAVDINEIHLHHNYDKTRLYQLMNTLQNGLLYSSSMIHNERYLGLAKRVGVYNPIGFQLRKWF